MADTPEDKKAKGKPTLKDDQIDTKRGMDRRSVLRGFGLGGRG